MPVVTDVRSFDTVPVEVRANAIDDGYVTNVGASTVYYGRVPGVTVATATGSIAPSASLAFTETRYFVAATSARILIQVGYGLASANPSDSGKAIDAFGGSPIVAGGGAILPWATGTSYIQGQAVTNGGNTYTANDAHTSGATFAGDLAGHWTTLPVGSGGSLVTVTAVTDDYTLVLGDASKAVEMTAATAKTITVPPNASVAFDVGTVIEVARLGAGTVNILAGSGVTIRSPQTLTALASQYSVASLRKRATNEWVLAGDLSS